MSSDAGKKPEASGGRAPLTIREVSDRNDPPRGLPGAGGSGSHSDDPRDYYTGGEKRSLSLSSF
jgi:UBX domain-containing protein 1